MRMLEQHILKLTNAKEILGVETLQELWSGYGTIKRYALKGTAFPSVVVKHIRLTSDSSHPRGWNTSRSHLRKLRSYQVESQWYSNWSRRCTANCRVPQCYAVDKHDSEILLYLEDLDASGFSERRTSANRTEIQACLKWLAHFHACFLGQSPDGLWQVGTYWHLATRPDELNALKDIALKKAASAIDRRLSEAKYQTFVHGDAKIANFCFERSGRKVAAVDFQYVGGGCGMKDVAYFIGSCLSEAECEEQADELLDYYFAVLKSVLAAKEPAVNAAALEEEWRGLFPLAWADFHRFLKGWSPEHWKINDYSERVCRKVVQSLV